MPDIQSMAKFDMKSFDEVAAVSGKERKIDEGEKRRKKKLIAQNGEQQRSVMEKF